MVGLVTKRVFVGISIPTASRILHNLSAVYWTTGVFLVSELYGTNQDLHYVL